MGAWDVGTFDNDTACDWGYDLENVTDLSLVRATIERVTGSGDAYLDSDLACEALAACEVLARLKGNHGVRNAYTETIDTWVAAHPQEPPAELRAAAIAAIDRILAQSSELRELWDESDAGDAWCKAVADLRARVSR